MGDHEAQGCRGGAGPSQESGCSCWRQARGGHRGMQIVKRVQVSGCKARGIPQGRRHRGDHQSGKAAKGCFEVRVGDKAVVSLLALPRPFLKLKALEMEDVAKAVIK